VKEDDYCLKLVGSKQICLRQKKYDDEVTFSGHLLYWLFFLLIGYNVRFPIWRVRCLVVTGKMPACADVLFVREI